MTTSSITKSRQTGRHNFAIHLIAALSCLVYAWQVSKTAYIQTGLQFVTPLLIIMICHLAWLLWFRQPGQALAPVLFKRSLQSSLSIVAIAFLAQTLAPMPSNASGFNATFGNILMVLFCLFVLVLVTSTIALLIYGAYSISASIYKRITKKDDDTGGNSLHDVASVVLAFGVLIILSLEGLPRGYHFDGRNQHGASYYVDASPAEVWATMQTATSAEFPLPTILQAFPQPVAVLVDEGTDLGARRVVKVRGREGVGTLHLSVTERDANKAVFQVHKDSTPLRNWASFETIEYHVSPEGLGTRLSVTLGFERLLAPALIFDPMMHIAAYFGMSVLARDTKLRAEALNRQTQSTDKDA